MSSHPFSKPRQSLIFAAAQLQFRLFVNRSSPAVLDFVAPGGEIIANTSLALGTTATVWSSIGLLPHDAGLSVRFFEHAQIHTPMRFCLSLACRDDRVKARSKHTTRTYAFYWCLEDCINFTCPCTRQRGWSCLCTRNCFLLQPRRMAPLRSLPTKYVRFNQWHSRVLCLPKRIVHFCCWRDGVRVVPVSTSGGGGDVGTTGRASMRCMWPVLLSRGE